MAQARTSAVILGILSLLLPAALSLLPAAEAQFTNVTCLSTTSWTYNSRGQNPCLIAAYLQGACLSDPSWSVWTLSSKNVTYANPTITQANECTCSSVVFSLLSACAYCQGSNIPYWAEWTENCLSSDISNGQYPHVLPGGTAVPAWAYLPVTETVWQSGQAQSLASTDAAESSAAGGPTPAVSPGVSSSISSSSSASASQTTAPASSKSSSNVGPIVGGVVGGVLGLAIIAVIFFFLYRYFKNKESQNRTVDPYSNGGSMGVAPYPTEGKNSVPPPSSPREFNPLLGNMNSPPPMMKVYDPEDPTTWPTFEPPTPTAHSGYPSPPSQASLVPNRSPPPIEL
ncbi:hypothetical protein NLI96_g9652 [Meripilus lineatus]|uniref:Transmembrane protein n=1 Tax=Meripilus lineatus TaxID=2056292 RepID=A0AAD5UV36_9APHY|nr:hypothetical protein NLI96_g9652 [Physisporinus lineatus]